MFKFIGFCVCLAALIITLSWFTKGNENMPKSIAQSMDQVHDTTKVVAPIVARGVSSTTTKIVAAASAASAELKK